MEIKITAESPGHTSMDVDDDALAEAYREGGMEAVQTLLCEEADGMSETPFWWPEAPSEDDMKRLAARVGDDE